MRRQLLLLLLLKRWQSVGGTWRLHLRRFLRKGARHVAVYVRATRIRTTQMLPNSCKLGAQVLVLLLKLSVELSRLS